MRRTKEDAEISRRKIIEAAKCLFGEKGYAATKLEDIGKAVGMSRGVVYWHFKNKADLFQYIVENAVTSMENLVDEIFATDQPVVEQLRTLFLRSHESREVVLLQAIAPNKQSSTRFKKYMDEKGKKVMDKVIRIFKEAIKKGKIKNDTDIRTILGVLFIFMNGLTNSDSSFMVIDANKDSIERMTDMIFKGIYSCQIK